MPGYLYLLVSLALVFIGTTGVLLRRNALFVLMSVELQLAAGSLALVTFARGLGDERGQVVAKPKTITPHKKFKGEVYILTKEEGGRHTPFVKGYRPQFYFRTTDVTGDVKLPDGMEMVMPGDNVTMEITLITPIACEEGLRFAIREGGKTVGAGVVTKIIA